MVLDKIPPEVLLHIGRCVKSEKDLGSLVRTNRHMYQTLDSMLYDHNLRKGDPQNSCVIWAASNNSMATIKRAHGYGANLDAYDVKTEPRLNMEWHTKSKKLSRKVISPLHAAILKGFHEITQYLLENGATIDMPSVGLCSCHAISFKPLHPAWFPLHSALCHAKEGHVSAEMLIRRGARKEASGCRGLGFRAVKYQPRLVKLVASLGCLRETNRDGAGWPPLHLASGSGMDEVVDVIIKMPDTDMNGVVPVMDFSALHCSVAQRNVNTTKLLLDAPGVDVAALDYRRRTILYSAARGANDGSAPSIIALLVESGIDINQADENGVTPLYAAASRLFCYSYSNFMAVEALLAHGADPFKYQKDHNHWSIYHQLLRSCPNLKEVVHSRRAVLLKLLELGVGFDSRSCTRDEDVGAAYNSDATPLFFAAAHAQDPECTEILLKAGARPDTSVLNRESDEREESFLVGVFRHMWHTPERRCSPPLSQAGEIIAMLLKYGSTLEDVNGEESALEYACQYPKDKMDYALLDFLLENATRNNVSNVHLEKVIANNKLQYKQCRCDMLADHYDVVFHKLIEFKEREFRGQMM
ncbi:ankyrin repeat-containing domain protein [Trichoderma ceciliae]